MSEIGDRKLFYGTVYGMGIMFLLKH